MKNNIEKTLKRWLKRKVKITTAVIVAFLVGSSLSMAESLYIRDGKSEIEFSVDGKNWEEGNPYPGNSFDNNVYINNIELKANRVALVNEATEISLINNRVIIVESNDGAWGIDNNGTIKNLENVGIINISGNNTTTAIGNYNSGTIDNLVNRGKILVNNNSETENTWGINNNASYIGTLENQGEINIKANKGNIFAINNYTGIYENIINNGNISGESSGRDGYVTIINNEGGNIEGSIINNGNLYGNSGNETVIIFNGNYEYIMSNSINEIINNGVMRGLATTRTNGIDNIKYYDSIASINKVENNGLIDVNGEQAIGIHSTGNLAELINNGVISATGTRSMLTGTVGISTNGLGIENTNNRGIIRAKLNTNFGSTSSSAGINITNIQNQTKLSNSGIIEARDSREDKSRLSTYGIFYYGSSGTKIEYLINNGVVFSDRYTIYGGNANATNNGLLIGDSSEFIKNKYTNKGIMFSYDTENNNYKIQGIDKQGTISDEKTIINATLTDEQNENTNTWTATGSESIELEENKSNMIYNGITDTLKISGEKTLTNSIINGYTSAIVFGENGGSLTLDNSIINGGLDEVSVTIKGSDNIDHLILISSGEGTVINGNIDLGAGDDSIALDNKTQINGDLSGGDGIDNLTFSNSTAENNINIFNKIGSFENINVDTNVTFFEESKVTDAENINISSDGNLTLRIDGANNNSHALSENRGTISSEGGKLLLALNGVGEGETINFGDTKLDESMKGSEEGVRNITIDTTSLLHNIEKINDNSVEVKTVSDIPYFKDINYNQLNKIYHSMRSTDQVKEFNVTNDEALTAFTKYLNDIYVGTPYSYSTEISRKTLTLFDEIAISKDLNPDLKSWAIYGGFTYTDDGTKDTYYGKGYYNYDIGSVDVDADAKIYTGYAKAEYGQSENFTTGIIFGGSNSEVSLSNGSKLEGDSFYFGVYGKQKLGNLKLTGGIGLQHGDYKADRKANGYGGITATKEFSENYHDRGFNIYLDGRYSYTLGNNFFLEPRMTVDYNRIQQDEASESGALGIEVDSKIFETVSGTVGVDIKKVIPTETLTHELALGVSYNTFFKGDKEEYLTGRFVGGNNFDILVGEKADTVSLNGKYELITEKGFTFDVRGSYSFEHENAKNKWTLGAGIGYKF